MGSGISTMSSAWTSTYNEIKTKHDQAYTAIEEAITLEEQDKPQQALEKYKHGIHLIDSALQVQVTCPEYPDPTWEKAVQMIKKMKQSRAEVLTRITSIQKSNESCQVAEEQPPSYDEVIADTPTDTPHTYNELANALQQMTVDSNMTMEAEVMYMYENVLLYFISPGGEVSSTLQSQTLKITLVENASENPNAPRAILQVGDWVYPLVPGVSPCYRTEFGAFILPNIYADTPGSSIGFILPPDADADAYEILESILYGIVGKGKPPEELSQKISDGIVTGASYLSRGLIFGAEKIGLLLNQNTPKLINQISSDDQPSEIPSGVSKGMKIAETATCKAAQVTGFVAEQVGVATMKLGHFLAPHIQKGGTRLLTSTLHMSEDDASNKMKGVLTVAAGAVEGFSTVYGALENSASILGASLKDNTIKVIHHKYGQPAGDFAGNTLNTVGNVYHISQNARVVQPKHLVKKTAKEAGKAIVHGYNEGASTSANFSSLPPYKIDNRLDKN